MCSESLSLFLQQYLNVGVVLIKPVLMFALVEIELLMRCIVENVTLLEPKSRHSRFV